MASSDVDKWIAKAEARLEAVYRRSVEMLGSEMAKTKPQGGRVPFQTGNLARSLVAAKGKMPGLRDVRFRGSNIGAMTATLKITDTAYIGYQANYARRMNYGYVGADSLGRVFNQEGNYFVEGAAAQWSNIVSDAVQEIKASIR